MQHEAFSESHGKADSRRQVAVVCSDTGRIGDSVLPSNDHLTGT